MIYIFFIYCIVYILIFQDVLGVSVAYNSPENTPAVPPLVKAISQHPDLYAVLSHFTNVMNVVTSHEGSGPGGKYALRVS